ncbi:ABC transporter permease [Parvularcula marina]|uniref:ABC transporter permease n=1 Tax=Parvularcula marina TaxID=2292771 RepID=A0A371RGS9_9PROT|nr:ABC transporter permease [Parvularcula marina]RFB04651.1 ABC transporter permease [Parvularcula marina]
MSASAMKAFINETGAEILKSLRAPEFLIPTLIMPSAFYSLFGVAMPGDPQRAPYLLATYGVFAVMGPSIFGFGVGVATERDRGWLQLKRAAPAPAVSYIGAKLISTLIFAAIALAPLYAIGGFAGGAEFTRATWAALLGLHISAAIPFVLLGLTLGFSFPANGAVAVANIFFLGLSVLGGLWMPIFIFPEILQKVAQFLPSYHLGELALFVAGQGREHQPMENLTAIAIMTGVLAVLAGIAWSRQR